MSSERNFTSSEPYIDRYAHPKLFRNDLYFSTPTTGLNSVKSSITRTETDPRDTPQPPKPPSSRTTDNGEKRGVSGRTQQPVIRNSGHRRVRSGQTRSRRTSPHTARPSHRRSHTISTSTSPKYPYKPSTDAATALFMQRLRVQDPPKPSSSLAPARSHAPAPDEAEGLTQKLLTYSELAPRSSVDVHFAVPLVNMLELQRHCGYSGATTSNPFSATILGVEMPLATLGAFYQAFLSFPSHRYAVGTTDPQTGAPTHTPLSEHPLHALFCCFACTRCSLTEAPGSPSSGPTFSDAILSYEALASLFKACQLSPLIIDDRQLSAVFASVAQDCSTVPLLYRKHLAQNRHHSDGANDYISQLGCFASTHAQVCSMVHRMATHSPDEPESKSSLSQHYWVRHHDKITAERQDHSGSRYFFGLCFPQFMLLMSYMCALACGSVALKVNEAKTRSTQHTHVACVAVCCEDSVNGETKQKKQRCCRKRLSRQELDDFSDNLVSPICDVLGDMKVDLAAPFRLPTVNESTQLSRYAERFVSFFLQRQLMSMGLDLVEIASLSRPPSPQPATPKFRVQKTSLSPHTPYHMEQRAWRRCGLVEHGNNGGVRGVEGGVVHDSDATRTPDRPSDTSRSRPPTSSSAGKSSKHRSPSSHERSPSSHRHKDARPAPRTETHPATTFVRKSWRSTRLPSRTPPSSNNAQRKTGGTARSRSSAAPRRGSRLNRKAGAGGPVQLAGVESMRVTPVPPPEPTASNTAPQSTPPPVEVDRVTHIEMSLDGGLSQPQSAVVFTGAATHTHTPRHLAANPESPGAMMRPRAHSAVDMNAIMRARSGELAGVFKDGEDGTSSDSEVSGRVRSASESSGSHSDGVVRISRASSPSALARPVETGGYATNTDSDQVPVAPRTPTASRHSQDRHANVAEGGGVSSRSESMPPAASARMHGNHASARTQASIRGHAHTTSSPSRTRTRTTRSPLRSPNRLPGRSPTNPETRTGTTPSHRTDTSGSPNAGIVGSAHRSKDAGNAGIIMSNDAHTAAIPVRSGRSLSKALRDRYSHLLSSQSAQATALPAHLHQQPQNAGLPPSQAAGREQPTSTSPSDAQTPPLSGQARVSAPAESPFTAQEVMVLKKLIQSAPARPHFSGGESGGAMMGRDGVVNPQFIRLLHRMELKIRKLYNWHLVELHIAQQQQSQLNALMGAVRNRQGLPGNMAVNQTGATDKGEGKVAALAQADSETRTADGDNGNLLLEMMGSPKDVDTATQESSGKHLTSTASSDGDFDDSKASLGHSVRTVPEDGDETRSNVSEGTNSGFDGKPVEQSATMQDLHSPLSQATDGEGGVQGANDAGMMAESLSDRKVSGVNCTTVSPSVTYLRMGGFQMHHRRRSISSEHSRQSDTALPDTHTGMDKLSGLDQRVSRDPHSVGDVGVGGSVGGDSTDQENHDGDRARLMGTWLQMSMSVLLGKLRAQAALGQGAHPRTKLLLRTIRLKREVMGRRTGKAQVRSQTRTTTTTSLAFKEDPLASSQTFHRSQPVKRK